MKNILFLLILLCIAAASYGQSYRYNKVVITERSGGDAFGFDSKTEKKASGTILIKDDRLSIDFKKYKIIKQIGDNLYKTKGGTIEYVYNEQNLSLVHIRKFNIDYYYSIKEDKSVIANVIAVK